MIWRSKPVGWRATIRKSPYGNRIYYVQVYDAQNGRVGNEESYIIPFLPMKTLAKRLIRKRYKQSLKGKTDSWEVGY